MALQWTPLRLSMVSGNNVNTSNSLPRLNRKYRKMADIGVQCDPLDSDLFESQPVINSTVAEINTSSESAELDTTASVTMPSSFHRPLSLESSGSISSGEEHSQRQMTNEDVDVDAIFVQQSSAEEEVGIELTAPLSAERPNEVVIPEMFKRDEFEESDCGLNCLSFTMQCCECVII